MQSIRTQGVEVSVETSYQDEFSNPFQGEFLFSYSISIKNFNSFPIKLHNRHWKIFDSNGQYREVEGEGVVGVQPELLPGQRYEYVSGCNLHSEMGKMWGTYQMENLDDKNFFTVNIPPFELIAPCKYN